MVECVNEGTEKPSSPRVKVDLTRDFSLSALKMSQIGWNRIYLFDEKSEVLLTPVVWGLVILKTFSTTVTRNDSGSYFSGTKPVLPCFR